MGTECVPYRLAIDGGITSTTSRTTALCCLESCLLLENKFEHAWIIHYFSSWVTLGHLEIDFPDCWMMLTKSKYKQSKHHQHQQQKQLLPNLTKFRFQSHKQTKMKTSTTFAAFTTFIFGSSFSTVMAQSGPPEFWTPQQKLDNAQNLWNQAGITTYNFEFTQVNRRLPSENVVWPWSAHVNNGVAYAEDGDGCRINWDTPPTVPQLFSDIQIYINTPSSTVTVTYDSTLGYPTDIYMVQAGATPPTGLSFAQKVNGPYDATINDFSTPNSPPTPVPTPPVPSNTNMDELNNEKAIWKTNGSSNYQFLYNEVGGSAANKALPYTIAVGNNAVMSAKDHFGADVTSDPNVMTLDQLFGKIASALSHAYPVVEASYDATYGFPSYVTIQMAGQTYDEGYVATISNYQAMLL